MVLYIKTDCSGFLRHLLSPRQPSVLCPLLSSPITQEDFPFELIPFGRNYPFHSRKEKVCFYKRSEALIWGMTANILRIFLEILKENPDIL